MNIGDRLSRATEFANVHSRRKDFFFFVRRVEHIELETKQKRFIVMHFPLSTPSEHFVEVLLFRDVSNSGAIMEAMKENEVQAALVDATMVTYNLLL